MFGPSASAGTLCVAAVGKVRVLIVDDQPIFAEAVGALLAQDPEIEIAGCVHDGDSAIAAADDVDVALVDMTMPQMSGEETTRRLLARNPRLRVVAVSGRENAEADALASGATSFLHKGALYEEVAEAVHQAASENV